MTDWRIVSGDRRDLLGEGVTWSARENAVYWVDILAPAVNRLSLSDGTRRRWTMPEPIGWLVEREAGGFIAGFRTGFVKLTLDPLTIVPIGDPEPGRPGNRMNDGKADRSGAIWCGTMDMAEEVDAGALYRLDEDLTWQQMDAGYRVPNGPAFSLDGRWLYHSDTACRTVFRFRRTAENGVADREPFIVFAESDGYPDGMTIDVENGLWIAHWGAGRISRFHADGTLDRTIALPARQITNVTFGGAHLERMFVTSATIGLDAAPADGALVEVFSGTKGVPTSRFAG